MDLQDKRKKFDKIWKVQVDDEEKFREFKNRTMNSINKIFGNARVPHSIEDDFLGIVGARIPKRGLLSLVESFNKTKIYCLLNKEKNPTKYIFYLQVLFWIDLMIRNLRINPKLFEHFKHDIDCSRLQINLVKVKDEYLFYPAGAKLLDEKVVDDVLDWISKYPKVHKNFRSALEKYENRHYERNLVDDLRLSLEFLLKSILGNEKSIENQKNELGKYLKDKCVTTEIGGMYHTLLGRYTDYQNRYVKHEDKIKEEEIEFMIYLTGTFMRFLMTLEKSKSKIHNVIKRSEDGI
ncbi:hypothetical protein BEH94_10080 [Candidatus Altiarchaeales archaeon WOR_SM1_SCG]|nr:hypothetical protein BEH94_10080 [Candidatus Altiarchaeales archaeon WOR_SM1_SCG]